MAPLTSKAGSLLRACPRQHIPSLPSSILAQQRRTKADAVDRTSGQYEQTPRFESPFKNKDDNPTTKIPSFANYMSKKGETSNKTFQYFMVGGMGLLAAAGAKATVQGRLCVRCQKGHLILETGWMVRIEPMADYCHVHRFPGQHGRFGRCACTGQS